MPEIDDPDAPVEFKLYVTEEEAAHFRSRIAAQEAEASEKDRQIEQLTRDLAIWRQAAEIYQSQVSTLIKVLGKIT